MNARARTSLRTLLSVSCAGIYAASLFFPVFVPDEGDASFIMGFVCLLFGCGHLPWLANPLLIAAHVQLHRAKCRSTLMLSGAAVAFGLLTLRLSEVPRDTSGAMTRIMGYHLGFHLWMATLILTFAGAVVLCWQVRRNSTEANR